MFQRKLISPLSLPAKTLHSASNMIFAQVECAFCGLIIFYGFGLFDISLSQLGLVVGFAIAFAALFLPLASFLVNRLNLLFFGSYHAPLLISLFCMSLFNAVFWTLGYLGLKPILTLPLMTACAFLVQLSLVVYRSCSSSITDKMYFEKNDAKQFFLLKNTFFFLGLIVAILLFLFVKDYEVYEIGFVLSTIILIVGLADFFVTYQILPIIKLKDASSKVVQRDKLKDIYVDFIKSFKLSGHGIKLIAFCLSLIFVLLFFLTSFIFVQIMTTASTGLLVGNALFVLLACFFGANIFKKMTHDSDKKVLAKLNLITTVLFAIAFLVYFFLLLSGIMSFHPIIFSVFSFVFGIFCGGVFISITTLFLDNLQIKSQYNLLTIIYMLCISISIIISTSFVALYLNTSNNNSKNFIIVAYLTVSSIIFVASAVLFNDK